MPSALDDIGLAAVDEFINTWNSRDPQAWAASLNFPHVRPAPFGPFAIAKDAAEYTQRVDFKRVIQTGWDHSEWDYKHVLHTSPRKIHVVGQWSRLNAQGEKILTNPVVYIVTLVDGHWGIQSRFSADYADSQDTSSIEERSFKLIETFINHLNNGASQSCAELLNYPHVEVGVGNLSVIETAAEYSLPPGRISLTSMASLQAGQHSINVGAELTITQSGATRSLQTVLNLNDRDHHLGIQAWSMLDPNEVAEG